MSDPRKVMPLSAEEEEVDGEQCQHGGDEDDPEDGADFHGKHYT